MPDTPRFNELLLGAQARNNSLLCVGLDPDARRFPEAIGRAPERIRAFNQAIIEATADLVCCYKPNLGFYVAHGVAGIAALAALREDVPAHIPILLDAKVNDMHSTMEAYARGYYEAWGVNAVTTNPYLGDDSLDPLLRYRERTAFVLVKTSPPRSGLLQERRLDDGEPVFATVIRWAVERNTDGNVGLVVGATYPEQLATARALAPELPILVPGVGAQGGDAPTAVRLGQDARGAGLIVSASRSVIYASAGPDFQDAARRAASELRDAMNAERTTGAPIP